MGRAHVFFRDQALKARPAGGRAPRSRLGDQPVKRSAGQIGDFHLADEQVLLVFAGFQQSHQGRTDDQPLLFLAHARCHLVQRIGQFGGKKEPDFFLGGFHGPILAQKKALGKEKSPMFLERL
jgi:hypothetical protein